LRVAVTGATGVLGRHAVPALVDAGHEVRALVRTAAKATALEGLGAIAFQGDVLDRAGLVELFAGCDAVCSLATHIPVGYAAALPWAWRRNDRLRTEGVATVVAAAREAGVRRVVQESVSFLYADQGDQWVSEESPLGINRATEPVAVGESHVQEYQCGSRQGVVLRLGAVVGEDPLTRWLLTAARSRRPVGLGSPGGWAHVLHTDDIGSAVVAALSVPGGVYNVGAEPVRRRDLVDGYAEAAGRESGRFSSPLQVRLAGVRVEPLTRSLRVTSQHFAAQSGWLPSRPTFDAAWLDGARIASRARR
jgi:nucleoside-diphosphate-sugar epimerase